MDATVIIKGTLAEAIAAAEARGFDLRRAHQSSNDIVAGRIHATIDALNAWLCELPRQPPYPPGTLLYWGAHGMTHTRTR